MVSQWPQHLDVGNGDISSFLDNLAKRSGFSVDSCEFARYLDEEDPLRELREEFQIPRIADVVEKIHDPKNSIDASAKRSESKREGSSEACVYFCGNSLGLMPKVTKKLLNEEMEVWSEGGVHGHFHHKFGRPWVSIDDNVVAGSARLLGAQESEVSILNTLTVNLHLLMVSFYQPTQKRFKILIEAKAFPSDQYAVESQILFHGFDPRNALLALAPREGELTLRTEDILSIIEKDGDSIALILFSGVQYYTGQLFDMEAITTAGHAKGCNVGFDLAHAAGNVELRLHDWNVDFAAFCSYKYLNSGPGSIAGLFLHERHHNSQLKRLAGWWGNKGETRFQMKPEFDPIPGAYGYRMSNPCVMAVVSLLGSLSIFDKTSIQALNKKTRILTGLLELLLNQLSARKGEAFRIITPADPKERGCQLSLLFVKPIKPIFTKLTNAGIVCDKREPDCIRVAPAPLYNGFEDVWKFVQALEKSIE